MFADVMRLASVLDIQRTRRLSVTGRVLVSEGDQVHPEDVIAETAISSGMIMIDLSLALGLPLEEAEACIVRKLGDELEEGDVVAQCDGTISRLVRAPADGRLVDIRDGRAMLAAGQTLIQVKAGMLGRVSEVIPEFGAVIQTQGSLVQGVWGNGKVGEGILNVLAGYQGSSMDAAALEDVENGQLLAGGVCLHAAVLEACVEKGCAGMILNRLAPELVPLANDLSVPVIVLSGFGRGLADKRTLDILTAGSGKTACVNASGPDLFTGQRPETIIPEVEGEPEDGSGFQGVITVGQDVRILSDEYIGRVGTVAAFAKSPVRFESGLELLSAVVQLEDGESVSVPLQNLMILR